MLVISLLYHIFICIPYLYASHISICAAFSRFIDKTCVHKTFCQFPEEAYLLFLEPKIASPSILLENLLDLPLEFCNVPPSSCFANIQLGSKV